MRRKTPWRGAKKYEDFRQKDVSRFMNYQRHAQNHIAGRNRAVAKVLCYLSMLRTAGAIQQPLISAGGALYQTTGGAQALDQEAAHCLPCQILTGAQDPTTLPVGGKPQSFKILTEIRSEFAKVTVLPRCFNSADKVAERVPNGLAQTFVASCREVVSCPRLTESPRIETRRHIGERYGELYTVAIWPINREVVNHAYHQFWVPRAEQSYESAGDFIEQSRSYLSSEDDPDEVLWILSKYLDFHWDVPSALQEFQMSELELLFSA